MSAQSGEVFCSNPMRLLLGFAQDQPLTEREVQNAQEDILTRQPQHMDSACEIIRRSQKAGHHFHPISRAMIRFLGLNPVGTYALTLVKIVESYIGNAYGHNMTNDESDDHLGDILSEQSAKSVYEITRAIEIQIPIGSCKGEYFTLYQNLKGGTPRITLTGTIGKVGSRVVQWDEPHELLSLWGDRSIIPESCRHSAPGRRISEIIDHPAFVAHPANVESIKDNIICLEKTSLRPLGDLLALDDAT